MILLQFTILIVLKFVPRAFCLLLEVADLIKGIVSCLRICKYLIGNDFLRALLEGDVSHLRFPLSMEF